MIKKGDVERLGAYAISSHQGQHSRYLRFFLMLQVVSEGAAMLAPIVRDVDAHQMSAADTIDLLEQAVSGCWSARRVKDAFCA